MNSAQTPPPPPSQPPPTSAVPPPQSTTPIPVPVPHVPIPSPASQAAALNRMPAHHSLQQPQNPNNAAAAAAAAAAALLSPPVMDPSSHFANGGPGSPTSKTTLWMGDLEPWMDENYLKQLWYSYGESVAIKIIRDKFSGLNAGYCFVDFMSHANAVKALTSVNGTAIPGTHKFFKLNWASGGGMNDRRDDRFPEYSIFVGDLGPEITDYHLLATFQQRYLTCKSAKVVVDNMSGLSRGYGFVRFSDDREAQRAMTEMQGQFCGNRPMRTSPATPRSKTSPHQMGPAMTPAISQYNDPNNTTVFVGGLSSNVTEDELRGYFVPFGDITYVKIPPGKGCGFVQFLYRGSAELAISQMNGAQIGNGKARLSWGRGHNDKAAAAAAAAQHHHPQHTQMQPSMMAPAAQPQVQAQAQSAFLAAAAAQAHAQAQVQAQQNAQAVAAAAAAAGVPPQHAAMYGGIPGTLGLAQAPLGAQVIPNSASAMYFGQIPQPATHAPQRGYPQQPQAGVVIQDPMNVKRECESYKKENGTQGMNGSATTPPPPSQQHQVTPAGGNGTAQVPNATNNDGTVRASGQGTGSATPPPGQHQRGSGNANTLAGAYRYESGFAPWQ